MLQTWAEVVLLCVSQNGTNVRVAQWLLRRALFLPDSGPRCALNSSNHLVQTPPLASAFVFFSSSSAIAL